MVGDTQIFRLRPQINGLPIYGADRTLSYSIKEQKWITASLPHESRRLRKRSLNDIPVDFVLSEQDAIRIAQESDLVSGEDTEDEYDVQPMFYDNEGDIRPVYNVFDYGPSITDRRELIIDAITGSVLSNQNVVLHGDETSQDAVVFPVNRKETDPRVKVSLSNVYPQSPMNAGFGVYGRNFRGFNACRKFVCVDKNGTTLNNGACDEDHSVCAYYDTNGTAFSIDHYANYDAKIFDLHRNWTGDGYLGGRIYVKLIEAPALGPKFYPNESVPVWGEDIDAESLMDKPPGSPESFEDPFAELQVYHFFDVHHRFMSRLFGDNSTFGTCLTGPNCGLFDPNKADSTFLYENTPFRYAVNVYKYSFREFDQQLENGKGKSYNDPIILREHDTFDSAYFSPSRLDPDYKTKPRHCELYKRNQHNIPSCLSLLGTKYPFIAFGQGKKSDHALNDCFAFHELTHAFIEKHIIQRNKYAWSAAHGGLISDPGALYEAWSDYFAAINCGVKNLNKAIRRNLVNTDRCTNFIGEEHYDSLPFSGALWKIRLAIVHSTSPADVTGFDQIVLKAMKMATLTETMASQMRHILHFLKSDKRYYPRIYDIAKFEFENRILKCSRVRVLKPSDKNRNSTLTLRMASAYVTARHVSVHSTQLVLQPRASDHSARLSWYQSIISPTKQKLFTGYATNPLKLLVSYGCQIKVEETLGVISPEYSLVGGDNRRIIGRRYCGNHSADHGQHIKWQTAGYDSNTKKGFFDLSFEPGVYEKIYIILAHTDRIVKNIEHIHLESSGLFDFWPYVFFAYGTLGCVLDFVFSIFVWHKTRSFINHDIKDLKGRDLKRKILFRQNIYPHRISLALSSVVFFFIASLGFTLIHGKIPFEYETHVVKVVISLFFVVFLCDLAIYNTTDHFDLPALKRRLIAFLSTATVACISAMLLLVVSFISRSVHFGINIFLIVLLGVSLFFRQGTIVSVIRFSLNH